MTASVHWSELGERSVLWGMRLLLRIYLLAGRRILQWFLYPVVSYYWLSNRAARLASQQYLQRLIQYFPTLRASGFEANSYQHFISFANAIIDKLAAWAGGLSGDEVIYHGRDALLQTIQQGRGALLFGSHLGNLEVCRVIAEFDQAPNITVLVHTKHAEQFNALLQQTNARSALHLLQVTEMNAATSMLLFDKIEQGELVVIAADRTPVGGRERVSRIDFLGYPAFLPEGPYILASLLKCPVFTLFCLKQHEQQHIYFELFSEGLSLPRQQRSQAIQKHAQQFADRLAYYCQLAPLQWFNFYDFWRDHA